MKKIWVLLLLITSVTAHAQKPLKSIPVKVITSHKKTVTGRLYSMTDSTISLRIHSKIKRGQLQSGEINNQNATGCTDSAEGCYNDGITTFSFREIEKVRTPPHNTLLLGILVGAATGARVGMWVGPVLDANNTESQNSLTPVTIGFLALNGAILGALTSPHQETYVIRSDEQRFKKMTEQIRSKYSYK